MIAIGMSVGNVFRRAWWPHQAILGKVDDLDRMVAQAQERMSAAAAAEEKAADAHTALALLQIEHAKDGVARRSGNNGLGASRIGCRRGSRMDSKHPDGGTKAEGQ